jgi:hypothetical protein
MAQKKPVTFDVTCPCCRAILTVDPQVKAVLAHTQPPKSGPLSSLDKAMEALRGEQARRDARFREATDAEKSKADVLARKFDAGLKRAKDSPDPPIRPFDFD